MIPYLIASEAVWLFWTATGVLSALATFLWLAGFVLILCTRSHNRCRSLYS